MKKTILFGMMMLTFLSCTKEIYIEPAEVTKVSIELTEEISRYELRDEDGTYYASRYGGYCDRVTEMNWNKPLESEVILLINLQSRKVTKVTTDDNKLRIKFKNKTFESYENDILTFPEYTETLPESEWDEKYSFSVGQYSYKTIELEKFY